ncbi:hypothetical protein [Burkholderia multivorans]|uniref:hypothetical protein n=1 Tax=Burkholderia multivorans TaxID=87883 RepID=UPI001B9E9582|nr:hypothetical protein [Burkholderia multivorans]MBR7899915.1 hypothetical protein [Burkholderia multivorans]
MCFVQLGAARRERFEQIAVLRLQRGVRIAQHTMRHGIDRRRLRRDRRRRTRRDCQRLDAFDLEMRVREQLARRRIVHVGPLPQCQRDAREMRSAPMLVAARIPDKSHLRHFSLVRFGATTAAAPCADYAFGGRKNT